MNKSLADLYSIDTTLQFMLTINIGKENVFILYLEKKTKRDKLTKTKQTITFLATYIKILSYE